jgi:hypothetical protein
MEINVLFTNKRINNVIFCRTVYFAVGYWGLGAQGFYKLCARGDFEQVDYGKYYRR